LANHGATLGDALILRRGANSLNFLRLVLASLVIVSHSITLGGFGTEIFLGNESLGGLAVDGFFGISGYLICASAVRHTSESGRWIGLGNYLWDRVLRIFPAYWVCLVVTAGVFGVIGWLITHPNLAGYWTHPLGPVNYVRSNFLLRIGTYQISGTPRHVPYPLAWNGSLWTLYWEFLCYLGIAAFAAIGVLTRRNIVVVIALILWLLGVGQVYHLLPGDNYSEMAGRFGTIFLVGALLYLFRDRVPDSGALAAGLTVVAGFGLLNGHSTSFGPDWLTGPALVYPVLWMGAHLPCRSIGATNDISYGIYIYGFVMGQLLVIAGLQHVGYPIYTFVTLACTIPLAMASWWGIEKWALKLRVWRPWDRMWHSMPVH